MKKTVSVLILIGMIMLMFVPTVSAAEEARVNVMSSAIIGITQGIGSNSKYVPTIMWDGVNIYNGDVAGTKELFAKSIALDPSPKIAFELELLS